MFGWEFPPFKAGGLATATAGLVKGLIGRGVDVTLVVPFAADTGESTGLRLVSAPEYGARLTIRRVASPLLPYSGAPQYLADRALASGRGPSAVYGTNLFEEVERFADVAGEIARWEPHDVIDTHDWITFEAGLRAQAVSGRPFVAHIHATEYDRSGEGANPAIVARERSGLCAATRVISNSHVLKQRVVDAYGIRPDRVDVVHWGLDGDPEVPIATTTLDASPVVLFLGRVTRQKGPCYFIEVARRVADVLPDARFVVAGDGDQLLDVIDRAAEVGLADRVLFTGGLDGADVVRAYRMADVCVMPSVNEPFGLVALESIRNGTPCVVPRASGVAEVLDNAFKVDFWDIEEMADKVIALARYRALHDDMRDRGLAELAEPRFALDEPARQTVDVYRRALSETH
jgi:glycosyltransferase involved in cell wall biosynthesis